MSQYSIYTMFGQRGWPLFKKAIPYIKPSFEEAGKKVQVLDDGAMTPEIVRELESYGCFTVISHEEADAVVDPQLQPFPRFRQWRKDHVLGQKLSNLLVFMQPPYFFMDSDVLFLQRVRLHHLFDSFDRSGFDIAAMRDAGEASIFSSNTHTLRFLLSERIKSKPIRFFERINSGFILCRKMVPERLEFVERLLSNPEFTKNLTSGKHIWFQEQMSIMFLGSIMKLGMIDPAQVEIGGYDYINRDTFTQYPILHFTAPSRHKVAELPPPESLPPGPEQFRFIKPKGYEAVGYALRCLQRKLS